MTFLSAYAHVMRTCDITRRFAAAAAAAGLERTRDGFSQGIQSLAEFDLNDSGQGRFRPEKFDVGHSIRLQATVFRLPLLENHRRAREVMGREEASR